MNSNVAIFSLQHLKKGTLLALKITLIFGVFFFIVGGGDYTLKNFLLSIGISALYSFVLGFGQGLLNDYLSSKWSWVNQTNKRVWMGIIGTILYTVPAIFFIDYILFIKVQGNNPDVFFKFPMLWSHLFWIQFSFGVSAFLHARGFMFEWKKSVQQETTEQKIVAKTETAKFETLKSQIDPHFLFNSLNVLTSLIGENPHQAERFTTKLSKIYRYVLEQRNKELVPIEEELQFAKNYMELLQMRFEDAVKFQIPQNISNSDLKIVPLSLQLLLENAVKHNVVATNKPLTIKIFEQDGFLHIENNKNPKEAIGKKSTKVGLRNIADRYGLITSKNVSIKDNNQTFAVSLPLLKTSENMKFNTEELENSRYVKAVERVEKLKEFYQNLASYVIIMPFLVFINLQTTSFHWFWFPLFGWGIGVLFHGLEAYNYSLFMGKDWEERKIKELMDNDNEPY